MSPSGQGACSGSRRFSPPAPTSPQAKRCASRFTNGRLPVAGRGAIASTTRFHSV